MSAAIDLLLKGLAESNAKFRAALHDVLRNYLHMTVQEFCRKTRLSESTVYKILSGQREPNLATVRAIIKAISRLELRDKGNFIAIIAARPVLDITPERKITIEGHEFAVREYAANSVEEAIIAAIRAERDGAVAVVCAPIVGTTVEKILRIPVATIIPRDGLLDAIKLAAKKSI